MVFILPKRTKKSRWIKIGEARTGVAEQKLTRECLTTDKYDPKRLNDLVGKLALSIEMAVVCIVSKFKLKVLDSFCFSIDCLSVLKRTIYLIIFSLTEYRCWLLTLKRTACLHWIVEFLNADGEGETSISGICTNLKRVSRQTSRRGLQRDRPGADQ